MKKISEYEILLIYVDSQYRKLGHATYIINAIHKFFYLKSVKKITLEVSNSNYAAIKLHKKNNYKEVGIRKNYYIDLNNSKNEALILEKKINV